MRSPFRIDAMVPDGLMAYTQSHAVVSYRRYDRDRLFPSPLYSPFTTF